MKYRYILTHKQTDSDTTVTRTCFPLHGDDLAISINRAEGEWYYTRNLDGKLVFERDDYEWIMGCEFDGTFTLDIKESHDNGATFYDYFTGTFSRASLEIDQDNKKATLNGLKEGVEDLIKNGKNEDYDLMKLIPDSYAKEVQGQVPPALALVDECSEEITVSSSDIYCGGYFQSGGYTDSSDQYWGLDKDMRTSPTGKLMMIFAEAKIVMRNPSSSDNGYYAGTVRYETYVQHGTSTMPDWDFYKTSPVGGMAKEVNGSFRQISIAFDPSYPSGHAYLRVTLPNGESRGMDIGAMYRENTFYSPISIIFEGDTTSSYETVEIRFHYVYASLLLSGEAPYATIPFLTRANKLDTGPYYTRSKYYSGEELFLAVSSNVSDTPNGYRMIPGTDELYFAPPDNSGRWHPVNEYGWNYSSLWYYVEPGDYLADILYIGTFRWTRCWTIGCCIMHLLKRITNDKVVFAETTAYSQFLYGNPNPVEGHEPFQWLVTQKSNVMRPAAGGASRCIVRLDWFFELLRNAFNCYYWFERRNDGRYDFRIEHVEYFRRGGAYNGDLADQLDLTRLKPYRNFLLHNQPAKHYADKTNRYTFDLDGMVEKYTYSWQGDGGGDDFRGNPMYFKAGWIEKGSSEDHQVDNIFADLGWLMLNAGTDTESSKNYDGLFIFGGYQPYDATTWMYPSAIGSWKENSEAQGQYLVLATETSFNIACDIWLTIPAGETVMVKYERVENPISIPVQSLVGTGHPQQISINERRSFNTDHRLMVQLPNDYSNVIIHRIHARSGNVFNVPNVADLLRPTNYLQNGVLAWPWLQCEYLHYDIPAAKWTYLKDDYTDGQTIVWENDGTIKMVKKQTLGVVPVPDASTEDAIMGIMGVKTGIGIGIIDNAKINLSSRNAEMTIIYDINPNNN